jgi:hypothetical protein
MHSSNPSDEPENAIPSPLTYIPKVGREEISSPHAVSSEFPPEVASAYTISHESGVGVGVGVAVGVGVGVGANGSHGISVSGHSLPSIDSHGPKQVTSSSLSQQKMHSMWPTEQS